MSKDWIIQISDPKTGRTSCIHGYTFDANGAGAARVCNDKVATSMVLDAHGVPNIPHILLLDPGNPFTKAYVPPEGNLMRLRALADKVGLPIVLKPLDGTGGFGVTKCACWRDVEGTVQSLFTRGYGIAASPFKAVVDEYRCLYVLGDVRVTYRKIRSHLVGDGISKLSVLVARAIEEALDPAAAAGIAAAAEGFTKEAWLRVPAEGEKVILQWRHNLGLGAAMSLDIPAEMDQELRVVASSAARAIGVRFCSVDVAHVQNEGLQVMEVNSGVMMDSLIDQLGSEGVRLAAQTYEAVLLETLGLPTTEIDI
uniref:ATP-grasp domain-containing protein n=1 Tax=Octactis speculum TaxID=3111310 RepID=A0A7S2MH76_9STRA